MTTHPNIPLVVVGTNVGSIVFLDYSVPTSPRIIENCAVHKGKTKLLKYNILWKTNSEINLINILNCESRFNSNGKLLFSLGEDNRLFVVDTRLDNSVDRMLLNLNQGLITNFPRINSFQPGFYMIGFVGKYFFVFYCYDCLTYLKI